MESTSVTISDRYRLITRTSFEEETRGNYERVSLVGKMENFNSRWWKNLYMENACKDSNNTNAQSRIYLLEFTRIPVARYVTESWRLLRLRNWRVVKSCLLATRGVIGINRVGEMKIETEFYIVFLSLPRIYYPGLRNVPRIKNVYVEFRVAPTANGSIWQQIFLFFSFLFGTVVLIFRS